MNVLAAAHAPGRVCPADYAYSPAVFKRAPDFEARTLYVAGGVYGNLAALAALDELAAAEPEPAEIVLNGDVHWFDAEPGWFAAVETHAARHRALRGNVETEIARPDDIGAGCGCAYPPSVGEGVVRRSNAILERLRGAASQASRERLAALPPHLVARVGGLRIGVVHGDAQSLAGWRFAQDALDDASRRAWLADVRGASHIDLFASTHTCLAALRDFELPSGRLTVANNGAAGMPNFSESGFGVVTRVAMAASPHRPLYGLVRDGVHVDALPLHYDRRAFLERLLTCWPEGSAAHDSYFDRIAHGPSYTIATAAG